MNSMADYWRHRPYVDLDSVLCMGLPVAVVQRVQPMFRDAMIGRLCEVVGPVSRVVDLGCGPGDWTLGYRRMAQRAVGVDINAAFIEQARRAAAQQGVRGCDFHVSNTLDWLDFEDCGLVSLGGCAQYLTEHELDAVLGRVADAQRGGGHLYVRTTVMGAGRAPFASAHGIYRRRSFYEQRFAEHGFRVVESIYTSTVVPAWGAHLALGRRSFPAARVVASAVTAPLRVARAVYRRDDFLNWILRRPATAPQR